MGKIADFVNTRAEARLYFPDEEEEKKVTVRLLASQVENLDSVASKLGFTRSGLAAELLVRAIEEAHQQVEKYPLLLDEGGVSTEAIAQIAEAEEESEKTGADPMSLLTSGVRKPSKKTKSG